MVDRDGELATLCDAIEATRARRGGLVVVEGAPGSGRTRLVREAAVAARDLDFRLVWLPDRGLEVASSLVAAAVDDATRGRPVVIVDDRQQSDSVMPVRADVTRLPVLVVATKTASATTSDEPIDAPAFDQCVACVRTRALRPGAVMALAAHIGSRLAMPVMERLHAATGGNALFVVETLAALGTTVAEDVEPWPLSAGLLRWMCARLDAMSSAARRALEVASVLGAGCDIALVERMVAAPAEPSNIRTELLSSGFVALRSQSQQCRFVPPLARDVIYASLSVERRAMLHARAAAALTTDGAASRAILAHHSLTAFAAGDARRCEHYVSRLVREPALTDVSANLAGWPYFVREGDHWAIGFGDRTVRLNDRTGLSYLAQLLSRPGVEFAALTLGERQRPGADSASEPREPTIVAERARVRVTRRIRDGIERITRVHPELGAHLERTVRTGARCVYVVDPENAPRWDVRWSG